MSSSSFVDIMQEHEGTEYPFPSVERPPPRSPSSGSDATPPYMARSLPEHRSSSSSSRRPRRTHHDHDRERSRETGERDSDPVRLLSRLVTRSEHRDSKHIRTLLVLTNDKLEAETRRADLAEQRVVDVLHRLRTANEATAHAQSEASRAQQEVRLYQIQLENAQREITRAQDIVDQVERLRKEAEEEAAKARSIARKCREEYVLSRARDEGRKQGYQEGLERGRRLGFTEAQTRPARRLPSRPPLSPEDDSEDMEVDEEPLPRAEPERRPISVPIPEVRRASPPRSERRSPPRSLSRSTRRTNPDHIPDVAPIAAGIPVPTLVTPINPPSPSHSRPRPIPPPPSPPLPIPEPRRRPDIAPISIREAPRSPSHPPFEVPPDNWIPYAKDNDTSSILIPPPHEFSRPVSPVDPSPTRSNTPLPLPPPSLGSRETIIPIDPSTPGSRRDPPRIYEPSISVRSRDYAYPSGPSRTRATTTAVTSPQSRTSTRISEYDILGRPSFASIYRQQDADRDSLGSGRPRLYRDREIPTALARGPREPTVPEYPLEAGAGPSDEEDRPVYIRHTSSESSRAPLDEMFRDKYKRRRSPDHSQDSHPVPDITVESPSTDGSRPSTVATTAAPHLLSPEYAHSALPALTEMLGGASSSSRHHHQQSQNPLPILPTSMLQNLRPGSPYTEAPVPSDIVYPEPPGRSKSRASNRDRRRVPVVTSESSEGTGDSVSYKSRRGTIDSSSLGGRLSPLSLFK